VTTPAPGLGTFVAALDREARRRTVLDESGGVTDLDGIDFVEVLSNRPGTPDRVAGAPAQRTLLVHLLKRPVPAIWDAAAVEIVGGVRGDPSINPVRVQWAYPATALVGDSTTAPTDPLPGVRPADRRLIAEAITDPSRRAGAFVVRTSSAGDWSGYLLRLLDESGRSAPTGFDPALAEAVFSFKVDCPSDLDCRADPTPPVADPGTPALDYLARDYAALRTRLIDRLAVLMPNWRDRSPADVGVALAELFAYLGDRLSYRQDSIATEAYLGTARLRTSVRRHARLLDYRMHEGCAARTFLAFSSDTAVQLPAGVPVADWLPAGLGDRPPTGADVAELGAVVMQTCAPVALDPDRNVLPLYSWGDEDHVLAAGTTAAFLTAGLSGRLPQLRRGDVLLLAELPVGGSVAGGPETGDPAARQAIRLAADPVRHEDHTLDPPLPVLEIRWPSADALARPLRVSEPGGTGLPVVRAVALANVALADHGASVGPEDLIPAQAPVTPSTSEYRPRLARTGVTHADPIPAGGGPTGRFASAVAALRAAPERALASVELDDGLRGWSPRQDLLASGRLDPHFVVEIEADAVARIRFGDGIGGRRPARGDRLRAWYRVGGGQFGNVTAGRLTHLLALPDGGSAVPDGAAVTVWNPLPAVGGVDPQPIREVQLLAPRSFRSQLRAVTSADYAAVAMADPAVQRAVARRRWTGSWYAQEVTVDPVADAATEPDWAARLTATLDVRRLAGVDVELADPVDVAVQITVDGCVKPGYRRAQVTAAVIDALSSRTLADSRRGFFHVDNFTFGTPLYLSDLVATVMAVPGVLWVDVTRFGRAGAARRDQALALRNGVITVGAREVLRCDSDPNHPEAGAIQVVLRGGS
jgi:hypothetical protein